MTDEELGRNIIKSRNLRGLSQENIAESLGMSQKNYSRIENGELSATFKMIVQISELLNVELVKLLNFTDSIVFNNITHEQQGEFNAYNNTEIKFVKELYEKLLHEKEALIEVKDQLISALSSSQNN